MADVDEMTQFVTMNMHSLSKLHTPVININLRKNKQNTFLPIEVKKLLKLSDRKKSKLKYTGRYMEQKAIIWKLEMIIKKKRK